MKNIYFQILLSICFYCLAIEHVNSSDTDGAVESNKRDGLLGESRVYHYYSDEKDNPAWRKDIITADGPGLSNLRDRQGVLASKQASVAIEVATSNLQQMAVLFSHVQQNH